MTWCCLRPPLLLAALATLCLPTTALPADASRPIVPGFESFPADAARGGQLLLTELNCVSCHQPSDPSLTPKQAPILDHIGACARAT